MRLSFSHHGTRLVSAVCPISQRAITYPPNLPSPSFFPAKPLFLFSAPASLLLLDKNLGVDWSCANRTRVSVSRFIETRFLHLFAVGTPNHHRLFLAWFCHLGSSILSYLSRLCGSFKIANLFFMILTGASKFNPRICDRQSCPSLTFWLLYTGAGIKSYQYVD